jgi:hypothetical protein
MVMCEVASQSSQPAAAKQHRASEGWSGGGNTMRVAAYVRFLLLAIVVVAISAASLAQIGIGISIRIGPPAIPVYEQPPCPSEGYIWTPGYWAYDYDAGDYYWVPGTWVLAPEVGFLWTPGWWGWGGEAFIFHEGYWGPQIGFYGGINYGFGYFGHGYEGGRWDGGHFFYNRTVNNVNITNIHNVYNTTVINNNTTNRISYNGGPGGINERPRPEEVQAEHERHLSPVAVQKQHEQVARTEPQQRASVNHGRPAIAATGRPAELRGPGAVPAKEAGAPYHPPAERGSTAAGRLENNVPRPENRGNQQAAARPENNVPRPPAHASEIQAHERAAPPNTGNPKLDQKYQQQQDKLIQKQNQQHQNLAQKQEQEHQRLTQRNVPEPQRQQVEQKHQQQTQQMEQKHVQQQQHLQQRQQPAPQQKGR